MKGIKDPWLLVSQDMEGDDLPFGPLDGRVGNVIWCLPCSWHILKILPVASWGEGIIIPFHGGRQDSARLSNLSKVTQLLNGRSEVQISCSSTPFHVLFKVYGEAQHEGLEDLNSRPCCCFQTMRASVSHGSVFPRLWNGDEAVLPASVPRSWWWKLMLLVPTSCHGVHELLSSLFATSTRDNVCDSPV